MCERLPGARVDAVTSALGLDSRIGYKYLQGAIGYGGPCFPRDNIAFSFLAKRLGVPDQLANATDEVNRKQAHFLLGLVESKLPERGVVGILGLTYKADTCVIEESQGLLLALSLIEDGVPICVFDPMGLDNARRELEGRVRFAAGADECARESDIIVIATPWEEFRNISPEALQCTGPPKVIVDCWRLLDPEEYKSIAHYIELGVWRRNSEEE
jgi:UDPglucose 6-dehydrogenase